MSEWLLTTRVYESDVEDRNDRSRPCMRWLDGVKEDSVRGR